MANKMNWALDPRTPKRSTAQAATPAAKATRKSNSKKQEEDK